MATVLREVDAVCIGVGFTGSILARELTKAGLKVVGLERGADRTARDDFALPSVRDDLKYAVRQELFQDTQTETVTLRHSPSETALPLRRLGSFLPGTGVGGAGSHWNGVTWRLLPSDHNLRSHLESRYGRNAVPAEMKSTTIRSPTTSSNRITTGSRNCVASPARRAICAAGSSQAATCSRARVRTSIPTSRWSRPWPVR
jgi:choline dehydrogenase-like flavoprotein